MALLIAGVGACRASTLEGGALPDGHRPADGVAGLDAAAGLENPAALPDGQPPPDGVAALDLGSGLENPATVDSGALPDGTPAPDKGNKNVTASGVPLPAGWTLKASDRFGTGAGSTITSLAQLHAKYDEGQFYNVDANGLVLIPNVVINSEQQTYSHFEDVIVFSSDHLTIQGRGHPDGTITSGEMVSKWSARSWCVEARYKIPSSNKSWPAFWFYAATAGHDSSELDFEQPITDNQGVHDVSMYNHPDASSVTIFDNQFTTAWMTWTNPNFDASAAPHYYMCCYDDTAGTTTRFIDGQKIYSASWKWNASLGGTGNGPDAAMTINLAVGGSWPGNLSDPSSYSGDLDIYSIDYYGP